jgi:hypothetical protein
MREALLIALVVVWIYSTFCAVMVMANRSGGAKRWFLPVWSSEGLSAQGLAYRRKHVWSFFVGSALILAWFIWIEPLH